MNGEDSFLLRRVDDAFDDEDESELRGEGG